MKIEEINLRPKTLEESLEVIGHLVEIIIELKKDNDELRERLNTNSKNSSLPPSKDMKRKKQSKPATGRSRGGQVGHPGWQRQIIPIEEVDIIVDCKPQSHCDCGGQIQLGEAIRRHQVFEIPQPRYEVTEYRLYKGRCASCHRRHEGQLPPGVSWKGFGVRAQGMLSLLTSKYRLSKRLAQSWFKDVYSLPVCLGSVSNIEQTVSESLKPVHEEVFCAVQTAQVVHMDETGHKENYRNAWAWLMSTMNYTYFVIRRSRGKKVAQELIGDHRGRLFITDRYGAYSYLPDKNHQLCWAHLKRDFQKIAERSGEAGVIGHQLLKAYAQLFSFWKTEYPQAVMLSNRQRRRLRYFKNKLLKGLRAGADCAEGKTARTCENILAFKDSLWHFFEHEAVAPTNNHAERQLRPLVISKKLTFGTQSERGSRFIERIFTTTTTCHQQKQDILSFLVDAIQHYFLGIRPPPLLLNS